MLSGHASGDLHKRVEVEHLLLGTAAPVLLSVVEHRGSLVVTTPHLSLPSLLARPLRVLLGLVPLVAAHVQAHRHAVLHGNRLRLLRERLLDRLLQRRRVGVLAVVLLYRANRWLRRSRRYRSTRLVHGGHGCRRVLDGSVDGGDSWRGSEALRLLLAAVGTHRAALDLVELVPVVHAPSAHSSPRRLLLAAGPALRRIMEHGRSGVVSAGRGTVLLGLVPLVAAVIGATNHARVVLLLDDRSLGRLS